jgi:hypothetical protein
LADSEVRLITQDASLYWEAVQEIKQNSRPFPVTKRRTDTFKTHALQIDGEMTALVRTAQKNFQFATIYEQRKTNSLLVAGFTTLSRALHGVGAQLNDGFAKLSGQIEHLNWAQQNRQSEMIEAMASTTEATRQAANLSIEISDAAIAADQQAHDRAEAQRERIAADQARRSEQQLGMLDNLQRGRRPTHQERGPRKF